MYTLVTPDRPQLKGDDTLDSEPVTEILLTILHLALSIRGGYGVQPRSPDTEKLIRIDFAVDAKESLVIQGKRLFEEGNPLEADNTELWDTYGRRAAKKVMPTTNEQA
ncbi:hypothetical protein G6O67_006872 [Ophiocordyceps sinensis]|uniref:Uncharacterized protein n=2 Tax=Ophiocordyceps sinensis TaxID=72228 RepID=A0A8H4PN68_9HYPO|nr:hypothetical protein OCS_01789 [Ophiocordyceps sinensis CO18]KAF4506831.1 hypothetical protein G6O67_006872 [Ophiocordyceps sinensis]